MIDTVIFDLGKVLVEYDWESYLKQFCFDEKTFQVLADAIFLSEAWSLGIRVLLHQKNGCSASFKMHRIMRRRCGKYLKDLRAAYINSLTQIVSSLIFVKKGAGSIIFPIIRKDYMK